MSVSEFLPSTIAKDKTRDGRISSRARWLSVALGVLLLAALAWLEAKGLSQALTLYVTPVIYVYLDTAGKRLANWHSFGGNPAPRRGPAPVPAE